MKASSKHREKRKGRGGKIEEGRAVRRKKWAERCIILAKAALLSRMDGGSRPF